MKTIKRLQKQLADGKITPEEYQEQIQDLLDDEAISQEEFEEAKDFEVETDDKAIYTQADVDRMIMTKARKLVKKALTDAGADVSDIENKDLLTTVGTLALQGQKKGSLSVDETELNDLKKKAKSFDDLQPQVKQLTLENAVLKAAGSYNPVNPKQVVRALNDYSDMLEYDEDDKLVEKSVTKALKRLSEAEPNLFTSAGEDDDETNPPGSQGFNGKPPGGAVGSATPDKTAKLKAQALDMMGIKKPEQQK